MSNLTISLPDDKMSKLKEMAADLGTTAEELVRASVEDLLGRPEEFRKAADYVLKKNEELLPKAGLMRSISLGQALEIHRRVIEQSGGMPGTLNLTVLESALQGLFIHGIVSEKMRGQVPCRIFPNL